MTATATDKHPCPTRCGRITPGAERFDRSRDCHLCTVVARGKWPVARRIKEGVASRTPPAKTPLVLLPACPFEGDVLERCVSCSATAREANHVRACDNGAAPWTRCTRGPNGDRTGDVGSCLTCAHRPSAAPRFPPIARRHLVYHLYPGDQWRTRAVALMDRWGLFDGVKVVAIATDAGTGTFGEVRAFLPFDAECFGVANDPADEWRERVSWLPLWERVMSVAGDDDAILRGHSKATRRDPNDPLRGLAPWWWAGLCESLTMDHWPLMADRLTRFPTVGAFKTGRYVWQWSKWHYAGAWYWVRAGEARRKDWRTIRPSTWGVESWPGREFDFAEGGEIFPFAFTGDALTSPGKLYHQDEWERRVWPEYRRWRATNPVSPKGARL